MKAGLYQINESGAMFRVSRASLSKNPYVQKLEETLSASDYHRIREIIKEAIMSVNPSKKSQLSYFTMASQLGYTGDSPAKGFIWDTLDAYYCGKDTFDSISEENAYWAVVHKTLGSLMMECVVEVCEEQGITWFCSKKDSNRYNDIGEEIKQTQYFRS